MLCRQARQAQLPADKDMAAGVDKPEGMQPAAAASAAAVDAAENGKGAADPEVPQSVSQAAGSDVARVKGVFSATLPPPPLPPLPMRSLNPPCQQARPIGVSALSCNVPKGNGCSSLVSTAAFVLQLGHCSHELVAVHMVPRVFFFSVRLLFCYEPRSA